MPSGGTHSRPAALGAVGRAPHNQRCKGHRQRAAAVRRGAPLTQTALLRSPLRPIPSPHRVSPPPQPRPHPAPCPAVTIPGGAPNGVLSSTPPPPPPTTPPSPPRHRCPPLHPQGPHAAPLRPPPPGAGRRRAGAALSHAGCLPQADIFGKFQRKHFRRFQQNGTMGKAIVCSLFLPSLFFSFLLFLSFFFSICAAPSDGLRQLRALLPFPTGVTSVPTRRHPAVSALSPRSPASRTVTLWGGAGGLSPTLTVSPRLRCPLPPPGAVSLRAAGHSGQRGHGSHHGSHRWAAAPGSALPLPSRSGFPSPSQEQS